MTIKEFKAVLEEENFHSIDDEGDIWKLTKNNKDITIVAFDNGYINMKVRTNYADHLVDSEFFAFDTISAAYRQLNNLLT